MHKQFKKEAPQGTLSKKDFYLVMKGMGFEDQFVHDLLFAGFDQDRDGVVNFKDFITSLSTLTRGTPDEKVECTSFEHEKSHLSPPRSGTNKTPSLQSHSACMTSITSVISPRSPFLALLTHSSRYVMTWPSKWRAFVEQYLTSFVSLFAARGSPRHLCWQEIRKH